MQACQGKNWLNLNARNEIQHKHKNQVHNEKYFEHCE